MTVFFPAFSSSLHGDIAPSTLPTSNPSKQRVVLKQLARILGRLAAWEALGTDTASVKPFNELPKTSESENAP